MIDVFKKQILKLLTHRDYRPIKLAVLAKSLGVSKEDYSEFKAAFEQMRQQGQVVISPKNLVSLPAVSSRVVGIFRANPKGFGFIIPTESSQSGDLFVPPGDAAGAMTGDTVAATVSKKGSRQGAARYTARITEILERSNNRFVGTLSKTGSSYFVIPDGKSFTEPIAIAEITAKNAQPNDKVVVEIIHYASDGNYAQGVITEVLGKTGRYDTEIKATMVQFNLPEEFSSDSQHQASKMAAKFSPAPAGRQDICGETIVTIDPPDAKDFDDAISLAKNADGTFTLGVHIADVANFIDADSPLDLEAKERGNSVYLPGKVIPMLPEVLSNGICSLQPGQKRFAKTAYITYDSTANVLRHSFANSIICSTARLTYIQAEDAIKGKTGDLSAATINLLKDMEHLAKKIEARRKKNGMLQLGLRETELIIDKAGQVVDAVQAENGYPHTIIEMFMVEANEAAAATLDKAAVSFMRRIHPDPESLSIKKLARIIKICGYDIPKTLDRFAIQNLLAAVKGTPAEFAVNIHVLRSLQRAEYSPLNIGHFALASKHYCHFTSPIRRYADLLVHRLLQLHIAGRLNASAAPDRSELIEIGKHITFTEQRAEKAEEDLKTVMILQMLKSKIGTQLETVVSGLAGFGVFVQCQKFGIEGMIEFDQLGFDQWQFNEKAQVVIGAISGQTVHLGQPMAVRIVSVNIPARKLSLAPVELLVKPGSKYKPPAKKQKGKPNRKRNFGRK